MSIFTNRVAKKMIASFPKLFVAAVALFGAATILSAQEPDSPPPQTPAPDTTGNPKPAGRGVPSLEPNDTQDQNPDKDWKPDTMPITGLQSPTVGNQDLRHSYIVPGFQYTSTIQNQQLGATTSSSGGWYGNHFLGANVSLVQQWVRSQLTINYSGGGFFTSDPGQDNGWYQQLALAQSFNWRRWQMQILDQFSYLPQSQFGFGGGYRSRFSGYFRPARSQHSSDNWLRLAKSKQFRRHWPAIQQFSGRPDYLSDLDAQLHYGWRFLWSQSLHAKRETLIPTLM